MRAARKVAWQTTGLHCPCDRMRGVCSTRIFRSVFLWHPNLDCKRPAPHSPNKRSTKSCHEGARMKTAAHSLLNLKEGEISRSIFPDPELYAQEQKQIFQRAWLYVGHESQIRNPGDYVLSRMGEESVIVARDQDGKIRVHLNS